MVARIRCLIYNIGVDIIKHKTKEIFAIFLIIIIIIIVTVLIFLGVRKNKTLPGPNSEELSSIIFINVSDFRGVDKIVIDEQQDIKNILEIVKTAERVSSKQSVSDFPEKIKFTTILFSFESGGTSMRSMYEENDDLYIDQPYDYIYKVDTENKDLLYKIINSVMVGDISLNLKEILNGDF